jgi:hypothetical protein
MALGMKAVELRLRFRLQHLDRHLLLERAVHAMGAVDLPGAAAADQGIDPPRSEARAGREEPAPGEAAREVAAAAQKARVKPVEVTSAHARKPSRRIPQTHESQSNGFHQTEPSSKGATWARRGWHFARSEAPRL